MNAAETATLPLDYTGESILGNGEIAQKTFATWLPAPIESVRRVSAQGTTWVHQPLRSRLTRHQIAVDAVKTALANATIPFEHTQTAPHWRQVHSIAMVKYGIELTQGEIRDALIEAMAS